MTGAYERPPAEVDALPERTPMDDTATVADTDERDERREFDSGELDAVEEELLVEEVSIDGMCGVY